MTTRPGEIKNWLRSLFPNIDLNSLEYIRSDASDRKYLRLKTSDLSLIIMDTKPNEEMVRFSQIANLLQQHHINAPQIINIDIERGLILMNDFGPQTYLSKLKDADSSLSDKLYLDAITSLIKMQKIGQGSNAYNLPLMNRDYIQNRMNVFKTWYLQQHLKLEIDTHIDNLCARMQAIFEEAFQTQTQVFVHLDYHSRNLMYLADENNPGILDFQDAMYGPITYDLASLFQDAYISWPQTRVEQWLQTYGVLAVEAKLIGPKEASNLIKNMELVALQRHIKNLGIFARLHYRDQKSNYMQDMPTLINYIVSTCNRYPELTMLLEFFKEHILELSL